MTDQSKSIQKRTRLNIVDSKCHNYHFFIKDYSLKLTESFRSNDFCPRYYQPSTDKQFPLLLLFEIRGGKLQRQIRRERMHLGK